MTPRPIVVIHPATGISADDGLFDVLGSFGYHVLVMDPALVKVIGPESTLFTPADVTFLRMRIDSEGREEHEAIVESIASRIEAAIR